MEIDIEFRRITTFQRSFFFYSRSRVWGQNVQESRQRKCQAKRTFYGRGGGGGGGIFGVPCDVCCPASFSCGILQVSIG